MQIRIEHLFGHTQRTKLGCNEAEHARLAALATVSGVMPRVPRLEPLDWIADCMHLKTLLQIPAALALALRATATVRAADAAATQPPAGAGFTVDKLADGVYA